MSQSPTYFWSGSNRAGEIAALAKHGQPVGVAVNALGQRGRALRALEALAVNPARCIVGVTRASGGRPILMFDRRRRGHASLPTGDVPVEVGGGRVTLGFRKIAVNVARRAADGANVLADLLRGLFGADAGARGAGHKVAIELTSAGWRMTPAELGAAKRSGAKVFVDSGAFGEVEFNAPHQCSGRSQICREGRCVGQGNFPFPNAPRFTWVDVNPITDREWHKRLDAYERIARALGPNAFLVAPDKVGDQEETLRRLALYAGRVRRLRSMGAQIIVPLQRGRLSGAEFDRECSRLLGFSDYIRGIPSKKAAATVEEIGELSRSLPADVRIHLLGLGPFGDRYGDVIAAIDRAPELVFCDSVRIKALVGTKNGVGGGPRILTQLTWLVKDALGIPRAKKVVGELADTVKFRALDAYFTHHFAGLAA